jgi:hypothetical protein
MNVLSRHGLTVPDGAFPRGNTVATNSNNSNGSSSSSTQSKKKKNDGKAEKPSRKRPPKNVRKQQNAAKISGMLALPPPSGQNMHYERHFISTLSGRATALAAIPRDYVLHLVDPEHTNSSGIPDGAIGATPTGLVTSKVTFDVYADGTVGSGRSPGRWGFAVSPQLGDSSNPKFYKIGLVANTGWDDQFQLAINYVKNVGTTSLTQDKAAKTLLMPSPAYYEATGTSTLTSEGVLGLPANYVVSGATSDTWDPARGAASPVIVGPAAIDRLLLPPGQFLVSLQTGFIAANGALANHVLTATATIEVSLQFNDLNIAGLEVISSWIVTVVEAGTINLTWSATPTSLWTTHIVITPTWARPDQLVTVATSGYPLDGGMVNEYVPVAMSVLFTCEMPQLNLAGGVAAALVPGNTAQQNLYTNRAENEVGNLFYTERLRSLDRAYSGHIKDGAYAIYVPSDNSDLEMHTPTIQKLHAWPTIVMSGLVSGTLPSAQFLVGRVTVTTTYQYRTDVKLFPLQLRYGSTADREAALMLLRTFPTSSPNGKHWDNIKEFASKVGKWFGDNKSWLGPMATAALSAL